MRLLERVNSPMHAPAWYWTNPADLVNSSQQIINQVEIKTHTAAAGIEGVVRRDCYLEVLVAVRRQEAAVHILAGTVAAAAEEDEQSREHFHRFQSLPEYLQKDFA